jgi:hypothetical protein
MKIKHYIFIVLSSLMLFFEVGCEDNPVDPETDARTNYLGNWLCTEEAGSYNVSIVIDSNNSSQIFIRNFHLMGQNEKAYALATTNNLTLPTQTILNNTFYGSATLVTANQIKWKYYVNDQTNIDTISAVYTR